MRAETVAISSIYRSTAADLTEPMRELLSGQPFLTLGTHNADGSIHLVPTWYLFADGRFYIASWSGSRKSRNAAARRTATVTVDDREAASWVSASGTAELITGEASADINHRLRRRYMTQDGIDTIGPILERAEDATIVVTPTAWKAWDYQSTMLSALENAGVPIEQADSWYLP